MKYNLVICVLLACVINACTPAPQGNLMRDDDSASTPVTQKSVLGDDDNKSQFQEALNQAEQATTLTKSAKSKNEWKTVANQWNKAILLMQLVPKSDRNYQLSQQKVVEYQKSLAEVEKKLKM